MEQCQSEIRSDSQHFHTLSSSHLLQDELVEMEEAWIPESLLAGELPRKATEPRISHWSLYKNNVKFYCVKALRFQGLFVTSAEPSITYPD